MREAQMVKACGLENRPDEVIIRAEGREEGAKSLFLWINQSL